MNQLEEFKEPPIYFTRQEIKKISGWKTINQGESKQWKKKLAQAVYLFIQTSSLKQYH